METQVILVDENDVATGTMEKMDAHRKGMLHRAFSVFIFNSSGQALLQRRAGGKYHSAGLWTNTCCSHPLPGENVADAANRRLMEEMGLSCQLTSLFSFQYRAQVSDLIENEMDHVFFGITDQMPLPNEEEADGFKYESPSQILSDMDRNPGAYTVWFRIAFQKVLDKMKDIHPFNVSHAKS